MRRIRNWLWGMLVLVMGALLCVWYVSEADLKQRERAYLAQIERHAPDAHPYAVPSVPDGAPPPHAPADDAEIDALFARWEEASHERVPVTDPTGQPSDMPVLHVLFYERLPHGLPWTPNLEPLCPEYAEALAPYADLIEAVRKHAHHLRPQKGRRMNAVHDMASLLERAAAASVCGGNLDQAADDLVTLLSLPQGYWAGGVARFIECHLPGETLRRDQVDAFVAALGEWEPRTEAAGSLRHARATGLLALGGFGKGDSSQSYFDIAPKARWYHEFLRKTPLEGPWIDQERVAFLGALAEVAPVAGEPFHVLHPKLKKTMYAYRGHTMLTQNKLSDVMSAAKSAALQEVQRDLAILGLLAEYHHGEQGAYPLDLLSLGAHYEVDVPADPCSGAPYHYTVSDDGFLLYGAGLDGVDNQGGGDDIVWRGGRGQ